MASLSAHIRRLAANKEIESLKESLRGNPSPLLTITARIGISGPIKTLVDGGSQLNLISGYLAKELDLRVTPIPDLSAEGLGGSEIQLYGTTTVTMELTDSRGRSKLQVVPFIVGEIKHFQICLGLPWIDACQPKITYASRRVLFRGGKDASQSKFQKIGIEDAEEFDKTLRTPSADIYALLVATVVGFDPGRDNEDEADPEGVVEPRSGLMGSKRPQLLP